MFISEVIHVNLSRSYVLYEVTSGCGMSAGRDTTFVNVFSVFTGVEFVKFILIVVKFVVLQSLDDFLQN